MGGYTVIADTSSSIIELLRNTLSPEPIKKPETIGLCQPNERGNFLLGVYLYNVTENPEMFSQKKRLIDPEHYMEPPMSFFLHYMIFAHSESEISTRLIDEQRILGKAIQQLNNFRRIPKEYLIGTLKENEEPVDIQGVSVSVDEKVKIWSLFNQPYHTSFFYKAGPIFMDTDMIKSIKRVTSAEFTIGQK